MTTKRIRIEFLQGVRKSDEDLTVRDAFETAMENGSPPRQFETYTFELRDMEVAPNGQAFQGVFAKYRSESLPHVGEPAGEERELPLKANEGIIEKNHFLYMARRQLLVFQTNRNASSPRQLGKYLGELTGDAIGFGPVLRQDSLRRLIEGNARPRSLEVSYAQPGAGMLHADQHPLSQHLLQLLANTGGKRGHIRITPPRKGFLNLNVRQAVRRIMEEVDVELARVNVMDDDGVEHVVDLIADRLFDFQTVRMAGRYPAAGDMFDALRASYGEHREAIDGLVDD